MVTRAILTLLTSFIGFTAVAAPNASLETTVETSGPRWEIRTAPIALLASWVTIDAGYRVGSNVATGPAVVSYGARSANMFVPSFEGQAIGWYANYYFRPATVSGWYTSLHAYAEDYLVHPHPERDGERTKRVGTRANASLGFRRVMKSIDMMVGGGLQAMNYQIDETKFRSTSIAGPERLESSTKNESFTIPFVEFKMGIQF